MERAYLQLEFSTGKFFEYSKTEKPGFEKHEFTNKQNETKVSYRKYYDQGIFGVFKGVEIKEIEINNIKQKQINLCFEDADGKNYIPSLKIFNQDKNIDSYAASFISWLPGMQIGTAYKLSPYVKETGTRKSYNIWLNFARLEDRATDPDNLPERLSFEYDKGDGKGGYETVAGDIPKIEWKADDLDPTKKVMDFTKQRLFLWNTLNANLKGEIPSGGGGVTFNSKDPSATPAPTASTQPGTVQSPPTKTEAPSAVAPNGNFDSRVKSPTSNVEDDDDLPF